MHAERPDDVRHGRLRVLTWSEERFDVVRGARLPMRDGSAEAVPLLFATSAAVVFFFFFFFFFFTRVENIVRRSPEGKT